MRVRARVRARELVLRLGLVRVRGEEVRVSLVKVRGISEHILHLGRFYYDMWR